MSMPRRFATRLAGLALAAGLMLPAAAGRADDTALFSAAVPPNVLLVIDNSGSMNEVVWHPAYDPAGNPTCNYWDEDETYHVEPSDSDTSASSTTRTASAPATTASRAAPAASRVARNIFDDPDRPRGRQLHALGRQVPQLVLQHRSGRVRLGDPSDHQRHRFELPRRRHLLAVPPRARHRREEHPEGRDLPGERPGRGALRPGAVPPLPEPERRQRQRRERRLRAGADQRLRDVRRARRTSTR